MTRHGGIEVWACSIMKRSQLGICYFRGKALDCHFECSADLPGRATLRSTPVIPQHSSTQSARNLLQLLLRHFPTLSHVLQKLQALPVGRKRIINTMQNPLDLRVPQQARQRIQTKHASRSNPNVIIPHINSRCLSLNAPPPTNFATHSNWKGSSSPVWPINILM